MVSTTFQPPDALTPSTRRRGPSEHRTAAHQAGQVGTPKLYSPRWRGVTNASFRHVCAVWRGESMLPPSSVLDRPKAPGDRDGGLMAPAGMYVNEMVGNAPW